MKQTYIEYNPQEKTRQLLIRIDAMMRDYIAQGFRLSVRQVYYQLVAGGIVENTERSYKNVVDIITQGRLGGYLDWDAIEDRGRDVVQRPHWASGADIVEGAARQFHMDMWDTQACRVFAIVEKAALAGVLEGVCHKYDVPLLAARGYPSVSVVREMALEHIAEAIDCGQTVTVLHLGDHDPSGIDMTRDLSERFALFLGEDRMGSFDLQRIALTMRQVREKNPPPNPAKTTDSRFRAYMREHGHESWELDALEPRYLVRLVESRITPHIDDDAWAEKAAQIEAIREKLNWAADDFRNSDKPE